MSWPAKLVKILEKYLTLQTTNRDGLSEHEREDFAKDMKAAYDGLLPDEKADVLVPARGSYLRPHAISKEPTPLIEANYYIKYIWPKGVDAEFAEKPDEITLEIGEQYDRLGSPDGRYMCPLLPGGEPQSVSARAVPYYIPEEDDIRTSPAYHQYTVKKRYGKATEDLVKYGEIASVFEHDPPDGGGTQVKLSEYVTDLIERGVLDEC